MAVAAGLAAVAVVFAAVAAPVVAVALAVVAEVALAVAVAIVAAVLVVAVAIAAPGVAASFGVVAVFGAVVVAGGRVADATEGREAGTSGPHGLADIPTTAVTRPVIKPAATRAIVGRIAAIYAIGRRCLEAQPHRERLAVPSLTSLLGFGRLAGAGGDAHFMVGITNSAPSRTPLGQRDVMVFVRV